MSYSLNQKLSLANSIIVGLICGILITLATLISISFVLSMVLSDVSFDDDSSFILFAVIALEIFLSIAVGVFSGIKIAKKVTPFLGGLSIPIGLVFFIGLSLFLYFYMPMPFIYTTF